MDSEGIFSANRGSQLADKNVVENVGIVSEVAPGVSGEGAGNASRTR